MKILEWLRPGIRIKRWFFMGFVGMACISFGLSFLVREIFRSLLEIVLSGFLIVSGIVLVVISVTYIIKTFFTAISNGGFNVSLDSEKLRSLLYEKRILIRGPKIVVIGGGTGLSTLLRGLKDFSSNITAIVTVADDGGGSGVLRNDLGMLPPGDIRNCILALADTEPIMNQLLQYRFQDGMLKGQSFGNLFLAAMDGISDSFEEAVKKMSDVLAVTGRVLPVTLDNVTLCAELVDGHVVCGESNIGKHYIDHPGRIKRVYFKEDNVKPLQEVLDAIGEADIIVLGPGSLYTSVIPNLLVEGVCGAIKKSKAIKAYICNVMTQPGETEGFNLSDHVDALKSHSFDGILDFCIVNTAKIPEELEDKYTLEGAEAVKIDYSQMCKSGIRLVAGDYLNINNNLVRHNSLRLAETITDIVAENLLFKDKKRMLDYYYIKDKLKRK